MSLGSKGWLIQWIIVWHTGRNISWSMDTIRSLYFVMSWLIRGMKSCKSRDWISKFNNFSTQDHLTLPTLQSFNMREIAIGTYLRSSSPRQIIIRWMYCRTPECSNSLCTTTSKPRKNIGSGYKYVSCVKFTSMCLHTSLIDTSV